MSDRTDEILAAIAELQTNIGAIKQDVDGIRTLVTALAEKLLSPEDLAELGIFVQANRFSK